jgi:mono/diheme cytochrome c family protein
MADTSVQHGTADRCCAQRLVSTAATWDHCLVIAVRNGLRGVASIAALLAFAGCAEDRDASRPMSVGEQVVLDAGCTSCHGPNGEGGAGPAWKGLYGSEVKLADGSSVTADEAYLTESIRSPSTQQVAGYGVMPANSLNDAEIQAVVEFIRSLQAAP